MKTFKLFFMLALVTTVSQIANAVNLTEHTLTLKNDAFIYGGHASGDAGPSCSLNVAGDSSAVSSEVEKVSKGRVFLIKGLDENSLFGWHPFVVIYVQEVQSQELNNKHIDVTKIKNQIDRIVCDIENKKDASIIKALENGFDLSPSADENLIPELQ
jgi:hypothetical protein